MLEDHTCIRKETRGRLGCMTSCTGLYADVVHKDLGQFEDEGKLDAIRNQYSQYKSSFAKNLKFDPSLANLSMYYIYKHCKNCECWPLPLLFAYDY